MRKGFGDSCPGNATGALLKEQNHNFADRFIDSKWIASGLQVDCKWIDKYFRCFFIHLNRLNSSMHGKGEMVLDVSETSSRLKVKCSCGSIELKMEEYRRFRH